MTKKRKKVYRLCLGLNMCDFLREKGYDLTYQEWKGHHDWVFCDQCVDRIMGWLSVAPLI